MPYRTKDITGKRFSKLTVTGFSHKDKFSTSYWKCLCDCGGTITTRYSSLTSCNTTSCGCYQKQLASKRIKQENVRRTLPNGVASQRDLFRQYQKGSRERGLSFDLSFEHFLGLTSGCCYYCGVEPRQIHSNVHWNGSYIYNGIDRNNNALGYTVENSVPCCKRCNIAKMDTEEKDFLEHVRKVYLFRGLGHDPVDDARGNAEAMLTMRDMGLKFPL